MKFFVKSVFFAVLFLAFAVCVRAETFHSICRDGSVNDVIKALKQGADINTLTKDLKTPLMTACKFNKNEDVIGFLIDEGADVNAKDEKGKTALMYACENNKNIEIVKLLLRKHADINAASNSGKTALMYACENNPNIKLTTVLVESGADVKAKTNDGRTALDFADKNENKKAAKLIKTILLNAGAGSQDLSSLEKI